MENELSCTNSWMPGMVGIITANTPCASGQLWELACAYDYDERIPVLFIQGHSSGPMRFSGVKPTEISGRMINNWTHQNILNFLNKVN